MNNSFGFFGLFTAMVTVVTPWLFRVANHALWQKHHIDNPRLMNSFREDRNTGNWREADSAHGAKENTKYPRGAESKSNGLGCRYLKTFDLSSSLSGHSTTQNWKSLLDKKWNVFNYLQPSPVCLDSVFLGKPWQPWPGWLRIFMDRTPSSVSKKDMGAVQFEVSSVSPL